MKKLILSQAISFCCIAIALAQPAAPYQLFGSYLDLDGAILHEYADLDYAPDAAVILSFNAAVAYAPGTYYTAEGKAVTGLLLQNKSNKQFLFKTDEAAKTEKLKASAGWAVKIGADSFVVANNFTLYSKLGVLEKSVQQAYVLQYVGKSSKYAFFKYTPPSGSSNYLLRNLETNQLTSLPLQQKEFRAKAALLLADYPELLQLIDNKDIAPDEIVKLMYFVQYSDALYQGKSISYTLNWQIAEKPAEQYYQARVSRFNSNWKLDFYDKKGLLLFTEHYLWEEPNLRHGPAYWYYPDSGVIRKTTNYTNGEADNTFVINHRNGKPHYHYSLSSEGKIEYQQVFKEDGSPVLDLAGKGTEMFYDATTQRDITREFQQHRLMASYYQDGQNRRIYQYASKNAYIKALSSLNTKLRDGISYNKYPDAAVKAGEQGIVLVKFIVGPKDKVESYSILRGVSKALDTEAISILKNTTLNLSFKSGKHEKEEIYQEIVVPMLFSLQQESYNHYHYYNPFWMNPIHNPSLSPHIPKAPPSMPRF